MININEIQDINCQQKDVRNFGLAIGIILVIIGSLLYWKGKESFFQFYLLSLLVAGSGLFIPSVLKPFHIVMMKISNFLGGYITVIILTILYYLLITPISLAYRLSGRSFLEITWDKSQNSYWNYRTNEDIPPSQNERQY